MVVPRVEASPWAIPRERARTLRERHGFAGEVLTLYLALLEVWEQAWAAARESPMPPEALAGWAAERVLPRVVAATRESGPKPLVEALPPDPAADPGARLARGWSAPEGRGSAGLGARLARGRSAPEGRGSAGLGAGELFAAWLAGADGLVPVERYLARASLWGPLVAVDADAACARDSSPRGGRRCPRCAGPPQLSFRTDTGDRLVSGGRRLLCGRCGQSWAFSASTCAGCGETAGARRTVYSEQREGPQVGRRTSEQAQFPHLAVEACASCQRYLIDVDLGRDPRAVPEVDELAALPLDLYAAERGLTKITPNLMGF